MSEESINAINDDNIYVIENENISVDLSILYEISGNDKNFVYRTVSAFLKNMPQTLNKIQQSVSNLDWENVYFSAHSAKSSLFIIKADDMLDWMIRLEENAKNKVNLDNVSGLVKKIKEKYFFAEEILNDRFFKNNK